jgi:hypothetical protein
MKLIDRKTGKEVEVGDNITRKNYKGFKTTYEVLEILSPTTLRVRKLDQGDRWVYLCMPIASLQIDNVLL